MKLSLHVLILTYCLTFVFNLSHSLDLPLTGKTGEKIYGFGSLSRIEFMPDGNHLLTSSSAGILLWDKNALEQSPELFFQDWQEDSAFITMSPDRQFIYTATDSGVVEVWNVETREKTAELPDHPSTISHIDVTKDNKYAVVASGNLLTIWDVEQEFEVQFILSQTFSPGTVSFSPDGTKIVGIVKQETQVGGTAAVWDWQSGEELHRFPPILTLYHLGFSPDGKWIVTSGEQQEIRLWDSETFEPVHSFTNSMQVGFVISFSPYFTFSLGGQFIYSGNLDYTFTQWDIENNESVKTFSGHAPYRLSRLVMSPDGSQIASTGSDHTVKLWDVESGEELQKIDAFNDTARTASMSPDGTKLVLGFGDGRILIRNVNNSEILNSFRFESTGQTVSFRSTSLVESVNFSPDGSFVFVGGSNSSNGEAILFDMKTNQKEHSFTTERSIQDVAISPDMNYLAAGDITGGIHLWDRHTYNEKYTIDLGGPAVRSVHFMPDGNHFMTSSDDGINRLWNVESGEVVRTISNHESRIWRSDLSDDGTVLLTGSEDRTLRLWDVPTGIELMQTRFFNEVRNVDISPNKQYALVSLFSRSDYEIILWNLQTNEEIIRFTEHKSVIMDLRFTPNGLGALSASLDGTVRLWDLSNFVDQTSSINNYKMID